MHSTYLWRGLAAGVVLASLAPSTVAQQPVIEVRPGGLLELGVPVSVAVKGIPGDIPYLMLSETRASTVTAIGDLGIVPNRAMAFFLPPIDASGESVYSCNAPLCDFSLAQRTYYSQAVTFRTFRPLRTRGISDVVPVEFVTNDDCGPCALDAATDDDVWSGSPHSEAFYLKGCDELRWSWVSPAEYTSYKNGTAWLRGVIADNSDPDNMFQVSVTLSGRESASHNTGSFPPPMSPKLSGVNSSALAENGGPIDPSDWHYYTGLSGTLTGMGDMLGTNYDVTRAGPAVQVGYGASLKNAEYGIATWLDLNRTSGTGCDGEMSGDINIILTRDCPPTAPN